MAGGQIDIRVEPDVKDFPGKLESGLGGALGTATKIGSALGLALGAGTMAKSVMDIGLSFEQQMNTMTAVSQGTAAQMDAVAAKARELGNDTDLSATSATDAAAAMTELAKGGFTVEQSMEAAKGTLQLAAAAQIDAADAATIQSQALQSFSLGAEDAARVSDILAGAANASSAEIEGIAMGLQQSGTVANQFGVSIDDTATALAMFANAGIQGSDAGTLLKSALLALTDQGEPAQGAIEELGLSVYDLQGNFVGLPALFDQLQDAQSRMTPEAYQAATATLFGSDAMRLAGIAAEQGGEGFESLRENVTRSGQAAEVAAAQTQGLPGALERAQNAAEDLGLKVYDAVKGPLVDAANAGVGAMEDLGPSIETAASMGAAAFSTLLDVITPAVGLFTDLTGVVMGLPAPLLAAGAAIPLAKMTGLTGALSTGSGALRVFGQDVAKQRKYFSDMGLEIGRTTAVMATMMEKSPTIARMGDAYLTAGAGMRESGRLAKDAAKETTGLARVFGTAGGAAKTFGGVAAGVAGGGMSLLKSGASGIMTMMGGPWGLALAAGGTALGILAQKHQEAAQAEQEHKAYQDSLRDSLDKTTGSITEQTRVTAEQKLRDQGVMDQGTGLGISKNTLIDASLGDEAAQARAFGVIHDNSAKLVEDSRFWEEYGDRIVDAGGSADDFADSLNGDHEAQQRINETFGDTNNHLSDAAEYWSTYKGELKDANKANAELSDKLGANARDMDQAFTTDQRERVLAYKESIENTAEAMKLLKDSDMTLTGIQDGKVTVSVEEGAVTEETRKKLEDLRAVVSEPMNGRVSITFDENSDILGILNEIGLKLSVPQKGIIQIDNYETEEAQAALDTLGITADMLVQHNGKMVLDLNNEELQQQLIDLGLAANIEGQFTLSDNFQQLLDGMAGIDGTQLNGDMHVSDNVPQVKGDVGSLNGLNTSSTHTIWVQENLSRGVTYEQAVQLANVRQAFANARGQSSGGRIPRNAAGDRIPLSSDRSSHTGYRLPTSGPGTTVTDGILGIRPDGTPLSWLDGGEWVSNARSSAKYNDTYYYLNQDNPSAALAALQAKTAQTTNHGGTPGMQSLASGGVVDSIVGLVNENFPMMTITSTYRDTNDLHGQGKAVDASNGYDDTPEMQEMAQWFYDRYRYQLAELIHSPFGNNVKNGENVGDGMSYYGSATMSEHRNHVHIAAQAPLSDEDETWKDATKDDDDKKEELTPEEESRNNAAKSAAEEAERRRKMAEESEPQIVKTTAEIGPDPVAQAMFTELTDPDGLLVLTRGGDYTPRFGERYQVSEDDLLVEFLLWAKGGQDQKDTELATAFNTENDPKGLRSLLEAGIYTNRFGAAFGVSGNSDLVTAVLAARENGGTNTRRVQEWNDTYGDVDTSVSGIAGRVAKSFVEESVGDVYAALGVEDDIGPVFQAGILGAKYLFGMQTGASVEDMRTAARDSGQASTPYSTAYSDMTAKEADAAGVPGAPTAAQYDSSRGAEQWKDTILEALSRSGRPASEAGVTTQQVDIESGGDPRAVNNWDANAAAGTPSGGLLQVIEPTRQSMREMFPEHHLGLVDDLFDPLENLVSGIDWAIHAYGGPTNVWPTTAGYAAGGVFRPMDSGKAAVVPPNTMRLIGDRTDVDEFYLPDTPDSVATGAEWARRRGLQLTIAGNQRRRDERMAAAISTQVSSGPTYQSQVTVQGFDRTELSAGIRMAERKARWKEGF